MKYRVWHNTNGVNKYHDISSPVAAAALIERLACGQVDDARVSFNAFGLEVFENGEWSEWDDGSGQDIMEVISEK